MTDKTHQMIGFTAATAGFLLLHPQQPVTWPIIGAIVVGSVLGSVTPDLDQPTANLWDDIPLGKFLGKLTSRALGGHRNLSHSMLGLALFTLLIFWITNLIPNSPYFPPQVFFESALIGFAFHLFADAVTVMGIPVFWPFGENMGFPPEPFHGIRIITGKWFENLVVFPGTFVLFGLLVWLNAARFCPLGPWICP